MAIADETGTGIFDVVDQIIDLCFCSRIVHGTRGVETCKQQRHQKRQRSSKVHRQLFEWERLDARLPN